MRRRTQRKLPEVTSGSKKPKMSADLDIYHRFDWGVPPSSKGGLCVCAAYAPQFR